MYVAQNLRASASWSALTHFAATPNIPSRDIVTYHGGARGRSRPPPTSVSAVSRDGNPPTPPPAPLRGPARDALILDHMGLVKALARRYAQRGESLDDLVQVGTIGLIKAVDRFDPTRDVAFSSFATPTILGEIRRHFRDRTWVINVPRGLKEANAHVTRAVDHLTSTLHRSPTVREIADETGLSVDEVLDAMAVGNAYAPGSLIVEDPDGEETFVDAAVEELGFARAENRAGLGDALAALPERERRIVALRFVEGLSQAAIGEQMGISQMHVSRLLTKSLAQLRTQLDGA